MKLIKSKFEIIEQQAGLEGMYKAIELAGRTCYKSEDKITEDSARGFVERMINNKHYAMLEHGTVYLAMPMETILPIEANSWGKYYKNKYSKAGIVCEVNGEKRVAVTTNLRVLVENDWMDDLQYLCEPTEYHEKRACVRFTCDRGVSHEFVRHRVMSFAQESTRYCNYSKDKFNNEVTYIIPSWCNNIREDSNKGWDPCSIQEKIFLQSLKNDEDSYFSLLNQGWKPQQARSVLPTNLKTELVMTGFTSDWEHFFMLRDAPTAHPDAQYLAKQLHMEFLRRKYIVDLYQEANPD